MPRRSEERFNDITNDDTSTGRRNVRVPAAQIGWRCNPSTRRLCDPSTITSLSTLI